MRAFAAVFAREIFERRFVFVVATAAGFVPLIGSLVYGWSTPDAAEGRLLVALVGSSAFSFAFALLFGGSVIAGETSEKRISFFFSRPIRAAAIWGGKLLAALFLTFVPAALTLVPAFVASTARARADVFRLGGTPGGILGLFLGTLFLVLGAHAVVTVVRLRSPWAVLDLILVPALIILAVVFLRSLGRNAYATDAYGGMDIPILVSTLLAAALLAALLAASLAQVAEGRTDARRAHGAFSVVFFGILGASVALLGGYAGWCASAKATDLVEIVGGVPSAPRGSWAATEGRLEAWRGGSTFLFDTASGRSLRQHGYGTVFSQDGSRAAWGEPRFGFFERKNNRLDIHVADLATGHAIATGLESGGWPGLTLSPDGKRLAIRDGRTLAVYEVSEPANPKQIAAFPLEEDGRALAFVDEDTIRLFPRFLNPAIRKDLAPASLEVTELSLPSKKSLPTGRFDRETLPFLRLSADARYFVGTRRTTDDPRGEQVLTLHDGRTGALLATLAADLRSPQARLLTGNGIAVAGIAGAPARVDFFEGEKGWGAPVRSTDLGPCARVVLGGEIAPGRVAISLFPVEENPPASARGAKLAVVDAATGAVSRVGEGLVPANRVGWWLTPVLPPAEAGAPASLLFLDASRRLVRVDPASGKQEILLGGRR